MKVVEFDYYGSKHFVMLKCLKNWNLEQKHFAGQHSRSQ